MLNYKEYLVLKRIMEEKERDVFTTPSAIEEVKVLSEIYYSFNKLELNLAQKIFLVNYLDMFEHINEDFMKEKWVLFGDNIDSDFPYTLWVGNNSYDTIPEYIFDKVKFIRG